MVESCMLAAAMKGKALPQSLPSQTMSGQGICASAKTYAFRLVAPLELDAGALYTHLVGTALAICPHVAWWQYVKCCGAQQIDTMSAASHWADEQLYSSQPSS